MNDKHPFQGSALASHIRSTMEILKYINPDHRPRLYMLNRDFVEMSKGRCEAANH
jgi:hypothetical protein